MPEYEMHNGDQAARKVIHIGKRRGLSGAYSSLLKEDLETVDSPSTGAHYQEGRDE